MNNSKIVKTRNLKNYTLQLELQNKKLLVLIIFSKINNYKIIHKAQCWNLSMSNSLNTIVRRQSNKTFKKWYDKLCVSDDLNDFLDYPLSKSSGILT